MFLEKGEIVQSLKGPASSFPLLWGQSDNLGYQNFYQLH